MRLGKALKEGVEERRYGNAGPGCTKPGNFVKGHGTIATTYIQLSAEVVGIWFRYL